jgi:glycosyltransferase 2 family protein
MKACRRESLDDISNRVGNHCERSIANVTSITARTVVRKVGRKWPSVALSLSIAAVAAFILWHLLRDIDVGKVIAALEAQPVRNVVIAGLFAVAGYITLTFYDVFALRIIGQGAVPFRVAALASFTSYTIGHSLGAATLTGGLVRLRVYSAWGLTVLDIAKIAFVTGMTFWLGNAFVLGTATSYAPEAASVVDHLPASINRLFGLAALLSLVGYLLWLAPRPRTVGYANWKIVLPSWRFTLLQIGIGATDLILVTLAMYTLLPPAPAVGFLPVLIIFVTATLLGTVSHVPSSLGVIEAAMLVGLPEFGKEELLASLLTFRVVYFVIPFLLAALALGLRELRLVARPNTR